MPQRVLLLNSDRLRACYRQACDELLQLQNAQGHWTGELSTSALSTATAVMALEMVRRNGSPSSPAIASPEKLAALIDGGLRWLADHQNEDGGWGDTVQSYSNISTTMLAHAVFHATRSMEKFPRIVKSAEEYIDRTGGVRAVWERYGKDRTFSVPILTHCALAGLVDWREVLSLPFELACLPARFYKTVRLPVVSYALPALIAIGQVRYHHRKPWNPLLRLIRRLSVQPSLRVLDRIQPPNGGFLEATPLTSFVTMSLASMERTDHPVTRRGVQFIVDSVRPDGSWPIDTNLATWVSTLSVNALRDDLPEESRPALRRWLLDQQYKTVHPFTNADPGGWAWTDLPGGVPDADDTPGAILALLNLRRGSSDSTLTGEEREALANAVGWLLGLQNRDGGWPTFCRGWGTLPFDRSAADISAHVLRAFLAWRKEAADERTDPRLLQRTDSAIRTGFDYLQRVQRRDGSWLPLWFGNQDAHDDENPTYGTARVLQAFRDAGEMDCVSACRAVQWLRNQQNSDGGWGGSAGIASSVEETALAVEALIAAVTNTDAVTITDVDNIDSVPDQEKSVDESVRRGLEWLCQCVEQGRAGETTPIGFYFAKLWYFEALYPLTFLVSTLGRAWQAAGSGETTKLEDHRQPQPLAD